MEKDFCSEINTINEYFCSEIFNIDTLNITSNIPFLCSSQNPNTCVQWIVILIV